MFLGREGGSEEGRRWGGNGASKIFPLVFKSSLPLFSHFGHRPPKLVA